MLALGRWQLLRADEKIQIIEAAERAAEQAPIALASVDAQELMRAATEYRRIRVSGTWLGDQQFLWDNRAHASQAGIEVVTPLQLSDGRVLLVNRGWQVLRGLRSDLPDVSIDTGTVEAMQGSLSRPSRGFAGGDSFDVAAPWPRYLQYFDYAAIAEALQAEVLPVVLQVDHSRPGPWLVSNWQAAASGPDKHYAYAVQWFSMAAALTVIFVVVNRRRRGDIQSV